MPSSRATQFRILFGKNWLLQKRKKGTTTLELGLPLFIGIVLIIMRILIESEEIDEPTLWPAFQIEERIPAPQGSNRSNGWVLAYAPENVVTQNIVDRVVKEINSFRGTVVNYSICTKNSNAKNQLHCSYKALYVSLLQ